MKKIFLMTFIICFVVLGYSHDQLVWCKKMIFGEPTSYTVQEGEYLSKIAKKYYGDASYWRELALINRAPNSNLVFPGEEIIVPSKEVIQKVRDTSWLSRINALVKGEEAILANLEKDKNNITTPITENKPAVTPVTEKSSETPTQTIDSEPKRIKSSSALMILMLLTLLVIGSVIGYLLYRKNKGEEQISIVDEIDIDDTDESEKDYKDYLRDNKKEGVLIN